MVRNAMDQFKSACERVRNILRKIGIADMESMRHVALYMLARCLTNDRVAQVGIPADCSWETLMELSNTKGAEYSLDRFKTKLIPAFDRIFKLTKFPFDVIQSSVHKEIMDVLDPIQVKEIDHTTDILGYIYEDHINSGSGNPRDLGQYYTDRAICKFIVDLVKPGFVSPGVPEPICDPTMGTSGILTCAVRSYSGVDWKVQKQQIHGCDIDERVVGLSNINMFMESDGAVFTNVVRRDSLREGLPRRYYKVILANPPFGIDPIDYETCHESIRDLRIRGSNPEPLFVQLMMTHLDKGGRCAVILPDTFFTASSYKILNQTREYLLKNFEVREIIKMKSTPQKGAKRGDAKKARFFVGTGVQCSILFFENTGRPTQNIRFRELERKDGALEVTETCTIQMNKIDTSTWCLDYRAYNTPVDNATTLDALCIHKNGSTIKGGVPREGEFPVMGGGKTYNGFYSQFNREGNTISVSKSGTAGYVHWHPNRFWAGDCLTIEPKDTANLDTKYLYYYLKTHPELTQGRKTGSTVPHVKWDDIKNISVPLVPLAKQKEIVTRLTAIDEERERCRLYLEGADALATLTFDSALA
jgi:hypothetical protein